MLFYPDIFDIEVLDQTVDLPIEIGHSMKLNKLTFNGRAHVYYYITHASLTSIVSAPIERI